MKFDTALYNHQPKAGAGTLADVASAMKRIEQPLFVFVRYPNATVAYDKNGFATVALNGKVHRGPRLRVFNGVGQQVGEDVPKETFIGVHFLWGRIEQQIYLGTA